MIIKFLLCCILINSLSFVSGLPQYVIEACNSIYDPKVLTTSCCPQIDELVRRTNECITESNHLTSCSQVQCIARKYDVLSSSGTTLDFDKIKKLIVTLDLIDNATKIMDALVLETCVLGDFTSFPAKESCLPWQYLNCVYFFYNIGCMDLRTEGKCEDLTQNIQTCRPHVSQYIGMLAKSKVSDKPGGVVA